MLWSSVEQNGQRGGQAQMQPILKDESLAYWCPFWKPLLPWTDMNRDWNARLCRLKPLITAVECSCQLSGLLTTQINAIVLPEYGFSLS